MDKDKDLLETLINSYEEYKRSQVANSVLMYDAEAQYKGQFKVASKPYQPLRVVQIYFDTATYDENVKDVSVTLADQLGAIGGTIWDSLPNSLSSARSRLSTIWSQLSYFCCKKEIQCNIIVCSDLILCIYHLLSFCLFIQLEIHNFNHTHL